MLRFVEDGHKYFWNNNSVPGVTDVIGESSPFVSYGNDEAVEKARKFGNAFHKTVELIERNNLGTYNKELDPWLDGWRKFKKDFSHFEIIIIDNRAAIESRFYSEIYGFAGMIDLILFDPERQLIIIIDWKTGSFSRRWFIQTAGYERLVREKVKKYRKFVRWPVQIVPGNYKIHLPKKDFRYDFNIFNAMLVTYRWIKEKS